MVERFSDDEMMQIRVMLEEPSVPAPDPIKNDLDMDFAAIAVEAQRQFKLSGGGFSAAIFAAQPITDVVGLSAMIRKIDCAVSLEIRVQLDALPWAKFFRELERYVVGFEAEEGRDIIGRPLMMLTYGELCRSLGHALGFLVRSPNSGRIRPEGSRASAMHVLSTLQGLAYNFAYLNDCIRIPNFKSAEDAGSSSGGPYPWSQPGD